MYILFVVHLYILFLYFGLHVCFTSSSGEPLIHQIKIHVIKAGTHNQTRLYATLNFGEIALNFAISMSNHRWPKLILRNKHDW